jgi:glycosyltransferase involved in cell wall biosynthesis
MWDVYSSARVHAYLANSHYVSRRIKQLYNQEAEVVYPPVDLNFYTLGEKKEEYYLTISRMVPYKKMDLIVEAFAAMPDKKLIVIGEGPEEEKIKKRAKKNIDILPYQKKETLKEFLQKAKGFICASIEDFGILPVEAQGCGTPVIALGRGGALETVRENETGVFFREQTVLSLTEGIKTFERKTFDPHRIRSHAESFREEVFQEKFQTSIREKYEAFANSCLL